LIWSFLSGSRRGEVDLIDAVPSRCGQLLEQRQVDAALVPVIEYQRIDGLRLVPEVCVGSNGPVRSVVLASKMRDLKSVRKVALDESSRTSATLIKILFREFLGTDPVWNESIPPLKEMLMENDAALIIGDPGMTFDRSGLYVYDLASLWNEYTGKGFVFAMWMLRDDGDREGLDIDFQRASEEGQAQLERISNIYEQQLGLPCHELLEYLQKNVTFRFDENLRKALDFYYRLAEKHGLISRIKPLNFVRLGHHSSEFVSNTSSL
jgi:chorismate dehydratase